ncbi:hypothetical protein RHECNPAF_1860014 [Rhizobium etli CNPAF512]|nr:hypothetical protein RHECNPAF_1860014 [Rhizobium etli CNPAF512]
MVAVSALCISKRAIGFIPVSLFMTYPVLPPGLAVYRSLRPLRSGGFAPLV